MEWQLRNFFAMKRDATMGTALSATRTIVLFTQHSICVHATNEKKWPISSHWHPFEKRTLAYSSLKKKYKIPLCSKKWNSMKTSPYLQVGAVWKHHYNVNPFLQKKIIKLPYSIAISCDFHFFSKYQYLSRFTFYQKLKNTLHNALAETFFDY